MLQVLTEQVERFGELDQLYGVDPTLPALALRHEGLRVAQPLSRSAGELSEPFC